MRGAVAPWIVRSVVALVGALAGTPGEAFAAPRACDLAITVTPATIPAASRVARIRIPSGATGILLRASAGTTSVPVDLGAGFLVADLGVPRDAPPVAILATVGENVCGWSVVRIEGAGTDAARGLPVTLLVVHPAEASADREADVRVYAFAVDERGAPRRERAPEFRPAAGTISNVESLGRGVWRGRWRIPAGLAGAVAVEAAFPLEAPARASLARAPGAPAAIEIAQEMPGAPGSGASADLIVRIRDSAGNLTDAPLILESDGAELGTPVRVERGVLRASVQVPPGGRGRSIGITARSGEIEATSTYVVAPSAVAVVQVTPPRPVRADGAGEGQLELLDVVVLDALGNPLNEAPVGSGGRGAFREAFPVGAGHWALPYMPPRVSANTVEQLVVRAGEASTTVNLELVGGGSPFSLGLKAGLAFGGGRLGPAAGGEAAAWLLGAVPLGLVLDVSWWTLTSTSDATVGGASSTYRATQSYLPVTLSLGWRTSPADGWMLWATAGGGGCVVSNRAELGGQPAVGESGFAPAASGSLSAGPRLGPGHLYLEARGTWIGDPKLSTLSGSGFTYFGLLGYRFDVG